MSTSKGPVSNPSKLIFAPGQSHNAAEDEKQQHQQSTANQAAQFKVGTLSRSDLDTNPFIQFHAWFSDPRISSNVPETVALSTATLPSGRVSSRMVYLKELDERGFVIYSNWGTSRKAEDVSSNPYASLCFWWKPVERQVRIEGRTERLTAEESQAYFDTRARGSRLGAWASQQTSVLKPIRQGQDQEANVEDDGRAELEEQVKDIEKRFQGQDHIPVPPFWGGLRVIPEMIEFWQGRESRLHDRFRYTREDGGMNWKIERLSP